MSRPILATPVLLSALFLPLRVVLADAFDVRITFPAPVAPCAIELVGRATHPTGARYDVTELEVPGLTHDAHPGHATLLRPSGVRHAFDSAIGHLLTEISTSAELAPARDEETLPLITATREFLNGTQPGRVFRITIKLRARGDRRIQSQTLHLVIPDCTFPRGVILGWIPDGSAWQILANRHWNRWSALFAVATMVDAPHHPGRSYLVTPDLRVD